MEKTMSNKLKKMPPVQKDVKWLPPTIYIFCSIPNIVRLGFGDTLADLTNFDTANSPGS